MKTAFHLRLNHRLASLALAGLGALSINAGEKIVFSSHDDKGSPPESAKKPQQQIPVLNLPAALPGQRIIFSSRDERSEEQFSAKKQELLASSLDFLKSTPEVQADFPLANSSLNANSVSAVQRPDPNSDERRGWVFDTRRKQKGAGERDESMDADSLDKKPKSPFERMLVAQERNRRETATNNATAGFDPSGYGNSTDSFASRSGFATSERTPFSGGLSPTWKADGDTPRFHLDAADHAFSLGGVGEKSLDHLSSDFQDRARARQQDMDSFRSLLGAGPSGGGANFSPNLEAARQAGAPVSLPGLGDFSRRPDDSGVGGSFRSFGGLGNGGNSFGDPFRTPSGLSLQPAQLPVPDPVKLPPAPTKFEIPRRSF